MGTFDVNHLLEFQGRRIATRHTEEGDSHTIRDVDIGSTTIIGYAVEVERSTSRNTDSDAVVGLAVGSCFGSIFLQ